MFLRSSDLKGSVGTWGVACDRSLYQKLTIFISRTVGRLRITNAELGRVLFLTCMTLRRLTLKGSHAYKADLYDQRCGAELGCARMRVYSMGPLPPMPSYGWHRILWVFDSHT